MPIQNSVRGQKVSPEMLAQAIKLRREMTPAEKLLWKHIKANRLNGLHFRRQQVVHGYYPDFYCHRHELIVEVDGGIHDLQQQYDAEREDYLRSLGLRLIRFTNEQIQKDLKGVLQRIVEACEK